MFTHSELVKLLHSLLTLPAETELVEFKKAENSFSDTDLGEYRSEGHLRLFAEVAEGRVWCR